MCFQFETHEISCTSASYIYCEKGKGDQGPQCIYHIGDFSLPCPRAVLVTRHSVSLKVWLEEKETPRIGMGIAPKIALSETAIFLLPGESPFPANFHRSQYLALLTNVTTGLIHHSPAITPDGQRWIFDQTTRIEGQDVPALGFSMVGQVGMASLQFALETVIVEGVAGRSQFPMEHKIDPRSWCH
jgi:hypothetical protein